MDNGKLSVEEIVAEYEGEITSLLKYIPWLESKSGQRVSSTYGGDGISESSICFPVYDSTLISFVKEVHNTKLITKNYQYAYSRYRMLSAEDELNQIEKATIKDMDLLRGILSRYVLGGMTKGNLWTEAVEKGIFLDILLKMKKVIEFWDKPLA